MPRLKIGEGAIEETSVASSQVWLSWRIIQWSKTKKSYEVFCYEQGLDSQRDISIEMKVVFTIENGHIAKYCRAWSSLPELENPTSLELFFKPEPEKNSILSNS